MLELNRISAGYGKQTVLDGISVDFEKGKLTSIIGVCVYYIVSKVRRKKEMEKDLGGTPSFTLNEHPPFN